MKAYKFKYAGKRKHIFDYEISRIEAAENYSIVHLIDGKKVIIAKTLKKFEEELKIGFFRINRSTLINLNYIQDNAGNQLVLKNGQEYKISRRRLNDFSILINKTI
jgi:two-component system, LytTR family, response regulator